MPLCSIAYSARLKRPEVTWVSLLGHICDLTKAGKASSGNNVKLEILGSSMCESLFFQRDISIEHVHYISTIAAVVLLSLRMSCIACSAVPVASWLNPIRAIERVLKFQDRKAGEARVRRHFSRYTLIPTQRPETKPALL